MTNKLPNSIRAWCINADGELLPEWTTTDRKAIDYNFRQQRDTLGKECHIVPVEIRQVQTRITKKRTASKQVMNESISG